MGRLLVLVSVFSFLSTSCGPSTTARQAEKDQENAILRQQKGAMAQVEGKWLGCLTDIELKPKSDFEIEASIPPLPPDNGPMDACAKTKGTPVILMIMVVDMLQPNTNKNEITEVPTMVGLFKTVAADNVSVVFTSGLYNDADGRVQLNSTPSISVGSGSSPSPGSGVAMTIMRLQLIGNSLNGQYISPQKFATVNFRRIQ